MARVSLSPNNANNSYKNLLCKEYCDGTIAVCYCPQCSAIFCDDCFNKEHQSERKMNHEKVFDVRPICEEHQHTLEFFDLTLFQPLCIMCLSKLQDEKELQFHVIRNINHVSYKLFALLADKIREARDVMKNVEDGVKHLFKTTKSTVQTAKDEVHDLVEQFKTLLDEREKEVFEELDNFESNYFKTDRAVGLVALQRRLENTINQANNLVQSQQHATIGYEFPHCYSKLNDLCSVALKKIQSKVEMRVMVNVSQSTLHGIQTICEIVPGEKTANVCDSDSDDVETLTNGSVKVKLIDKLTTPIAMETNMQAYPHGNGDVNEDVNVDRCDCTVTPIGDADFFDNQYNNDGDVDAMETMATDSNMSTHHDNDLRTECHTDAMASTPLSSVSSDSVRQGLKVRLDETPSRSENGTKVKRVRKRKVKSQPLKGESEDTEWSPDPKRVLRSGSHEKIKRARTRRGCALIKEMNQCDSILTVLWADENSWPFVRLVDRKKCPEYYEKVTTPMSLELVKEKLHSYKYRSVLDFVRDINKIIENCRTFNEPDVQEAGNRLENLFQKLLGERFPNFESIFQDKELMDSSL